jgi:PAS domain S-box-containing protein
MPWLSVLVGVVCGWLTWMLLDPILNQRLEKIFRDNLDQRLELSSTETRQRFEGFLKEWQMAGHSLALHWQVVDYLNSPAWAETLEVPRHYTVWQLPAWLEASYPSHSSIEPNQIALLDSDGGAREIFETKPLPFELTRLTQFFPDEENVLITTVQQRPYMLVFSRVSRPQGFDRAYLMLVVEIDEHFLAESQKTIHDADTVIALMDTDTQKLVVSSDHTRILPDTPLSYWNQRYLVTSQAMVDYQGADQNLLFSTLVSREATQKTLQNIISLAQQDRFIATLVYIAAFSLAFYLISTKISQVLKRISRFGRQALGIEQSELGQGNQLLLLESWVKSFFRQIIEARERLHRQQEDRLQESEVFKSALYDNSMVSIITLNDQGMVIEVNGTARRIFGYERDAIMGKRLEEFVLDEKDGLRFRKMLDSCSQMSSGNGRICRSQPMTAYTSHGEEREVECSLISIRLPHQTVFNVYLRDISGQKQAEREIASLAKLASENPSPVLRINRKGVIVYANVASKPLLDYWGCERGQTLPLYWQNQVASSLRDGVTEDMELAFDGQFYSLQLAPISESDYVNLYARDITQMRNAEMQSRQHQSELVHVCRLSTMGEMSTGLAHELNQPLSAIINFASGCVRRIQAGVGGEAELLDAMAQITAQAERAGEIIKHLRAMVNKRPHEQEVVNLNQMVLEVTSFTEYEANRKRVEVSLALSDEALPVKVDLIQIEQVLLNLVRNAIEAMKVLTSRDRKLLLSTRRLDRDRVEVVVEDNGPGIDVDMVDHLFDAFFSTKESGMGMGLPISKKIVEAHYGELYVESEPGAGAVFHVVLPTDSALVLPGY